ncbi:hypothetical protein [Paracidovorax anthurii]|uniref:hypothetical protein n=1 Tax=Paracidovorax anthurii TaxID=78229 RepID=UPI0011BE8DDB|nr:hypothetical protein [Paracidovorax anthurii]
MQKVALIKRRITIGIYFLASIVFHCIILFTGVGNYFHGGTPMEWIVLQVIAVLLFITALRLMPKAPLLQKIPIAVCAVIPTISVAWGLISAIRK